MVVAAVDTAEIAMAAGVVVTAEAEAADMAEVRSSPTTLRDRGRSSDPTRPAIPFSRYTPTLVALHGFSRESVIGWFTSLSHFKCLKFV